MLVHDIDNPAIYNANSLERNVREYKDNEKFEVILMNPPYGGAEGEQIKTNSQQIYVVVKQQIYSYL